MRAVYANYNFFSYIRFFFRTSNYIHNEAGGLKLYSLEAGGRKLYSLLFFYQLNKPI